MIPEKNEQSPSNFYYQFNITISDSQKITVSVPEEGSLPASVFNQIFPGISAPTTQNVGNILVFGENGEWEYHDLAPTVQRIKDLEDTTSEHTSDISSLQSGVSELQESDSAQDSRISNLENTVNTQGQTLAQHAQNISSMQESIAQHTQDINSLQQTVNEQGSALTAQEESLSDLQNEVSAQSQTISQHTQKISTLEQSVSQNDSDISSLQSKVSNHTQNISALQESVNGANEDISEIQSDISGIQSKDESQDADILKLKQDTTKQQQDITANAQDIEALQESVGETDISDIGDGTVKGAIAQNANVIGGDKYESSKTYAAGDYFIYNNTLCKALTDIPSGTALSLGDNYEATSVKNELAGLNGKLNDNDWTNIPNKSTIVMTEATVNLSSLSEGVYIGSMPIDPFPNALYVFAESGRKQSSGILCNAKYDKNNKTLYASASVAGTYYINVYGVYQNEVDNT